MVCIIIFGTRTMPSTQNTGTFNCPQCSSPRSYRLQAAKQWFTLYFIPVIPMGSQGQYVECDSCGGTFGEEILSYDPETEQAETVALVRRIVFLAMLTAGRAEREDVDAFKSVLGNRLGQIVTDQELQEDARLAQQAGAQLVPFVQSRANDFSDNGSLMVIQIAAGVFSTGRGLGQGEREVLDQLGGALGFNPQQMQELFSNRQLLLGETT